MGVHDEGRWTRLEGSEILSRVDVWPMQGPTLTIATFDGSTRSSAVYGLTAYFLGEASTITASDAATRMISLNAKKMAVRTSVSSELVADVQQFEQRLRQVFVEAMRFNAEYYILQGNGVGQPLGILNDPAVIEIAKVSSQVASTIIPENILSMYSRMEPASIPNSVWLCHPSCVTELYRLSAPGQSATGDVSTVYGRSLFTDPSESAPSGTLLGRPIIFTEKLNTLGTAGDIVLTDLSQVAMGLRKEISLDVSRDIGFADDTIQFRSIMRFDSQGKWSGAHTPRNGSSPSWVVTLATRS